MANVALFTALGKRRNPSEWSLYPNSARGILSGQQDPGAGAGAGLVTFENVPGIARVLVIHRVSHRVIASTMSNVDGEWRVEDLPSGDLFDVLAIDVVNQAYNDVFVGAVYPYVE